MAKKNFYAVRVGRETGIFTSWADCEKQVKQYPGADHAGFVTRGEAEEFMGVSNKKEAEVKELIAELKVNLKNRGIEVYTDGSFKNGRYSWAFVVMKNDEAIHQESGVGTNKEAASIESVAGELAAAMRAAAYLKKNKLKGAICHDNQGVSSWVEGTWRAKNDFTKQYKEFMLDYYPDTISFKKIKGHSGVLGNVLADKLAGEALK